MGCHHLNTPFRALKLKHPASVSASSTKCLKETAPLASIVSYEFPAREGMPPVRVIWYDGGLKPMYLAELEGKPLSAEGTLYVGEEGKMLGPTILSAARAKKFADVRRRSRGGQALGASGMKPAAEGSRPAAISTGPAADGVCPAGQHRRPHRKTAPVGCGFHEDHELRAC